MVKIHDGRQLAAARKRGRSRRPARFGWSTGFTMFDLVPALPTSRLTGDPAYVLLPIVPAARTHPVELHPIAASPEAHHRSILPGPGRERPASFGEMPAGIGIGWRYRPGAVADDELDSVGPTKHRR